MLEDALSDGSRWAWELLSGPLEHSAFVSDQDRRSVYLEYRRELLGYWVSTGKRPWATAVYEPLLREPPDDLGGEGVPMEHELAELEAAADGPPPVPPAPPAPPPAPPEARG